LYIHSLKIKNLRCFEETELTFQYPGREQETPPPLSNVNLLLGNNGAGKTTVLKAVALAALSPVMPQSGFVPYRLVRRTDSENDEKAQAELIANLILHSHDLGVEQFEGTSIRRMKAIIMRHGDYESLMSIPPPYHPNESPFWEKMFDDRSPAFLLVGYGATRRVEEFEKLDPSARRKSRVLRYDRVAGLFESHVSLIPLNVWLPQFQQKSAARYKQVVKLINDLLPESASFAGEFEQGEYLFEVNGAKIPFAALSDGYRAYIGWIADLLYHICLGAQSVGKLTDNRGIVMVDEVDLHLHPEWQRSVISRISEALPNMQFVFTTHSPLVAGSLHRENIFVMEPTGDGASVVKQYDERIYGLNSEQVLLSSYFSLATTRAKPFVDELKSLSVKAGQGDLKAALAFMEKMAGNENGTATVPAKAVTGRKAAGRKPRKAGSKK
jgi:energy-coupling factor transporter ATP-binding protein EcfA2